MNIDVASLVMQFMQTEDPDEIAELYTETMLNDPALMKKVFDYVDKYRVNIGLSRDVLNIREITLDTNHRM